MVNTEPKIETIDQNVYPEIEYYGENAHDVYKRVWPDGIPRSLPLETSLKLRNHSPTGFSWGYYGSGPAQLALALLYDATSDPETAQGYYQMFKQDHVSQFVDNWTIFRSTILVWLRNVQRQELKDMIGKN